MHFRRWAMSAVPRVNPSASAFECWSASDPSLVDMNRGPKPGKCRTHRIADRHLQRHRGDGGPAGRPPARTHAVVPPRRPRQHPGPVECFRNCGRNLHVGSLRNAHRLDRYRDHHPRLRRPVPGCGVRADLPEGQSTTTRQRLRPCVRKALRRVPREGRRAPSRSWPRQPT